MLSGKSTETQVDSRRRLIYFLVPSGLETVGVDVMDKNTYSLYSLYT